MRWCVHGNCLTSGETFGSSGRLVELAHPKEVPAGPPREQPTLGAHMLMTAVEELAKAQGIVNARVAYKKNANGTTSSPLSFQGSLERFDVECFTSSRPKCVDGLTHWRWTRISAMPGKSASACAMCERALAIAQSRAHFGPRVR
jgi:hypothetical protein